MVTEINWLRYMKEKYPEHVLLGEEDVEWGKDREVLRRSFRNG